MLTLDPSGLEVALDCFFAMHANLDWDRSDVVRHSSPSPSSFGAGELVLFVSFVAAASFVIMLVKALVTTSAFALGMINAWGLCHFFV